MKRMILMMTLVLSALCLSACNNEAFELWEEVERVNAWEATDTTVEMTMELELEEFGEKIEMTMGMKLEGYVNNEDVTGEMTMDMSVQAKAAYEDVVLDFKDIEMLVDGTEVYVSKNYIELLFAGMEVPFEELIEEDYILLKQDQMLDMFLETIVDNTQEIDALTLEILDLLGLDITVTKEDNTYTIVLDEEYIADVVVAALENIDQVVLLISDEFDLGLTQQDIDFFMALMFPVEEDELAELSQLLVELIDLEIKLEYTFEETKVIQEMIIALQPTEELPMSMEFVISSVSGQAEARTIEMPTSVKALTQEEIMQLIYDAMPAAEVSVVAIDYNNQLLHTELGESQAINIIEEDGIIYLPLRAVYEALGFEVSYDATTGWVSVSTATQGSAWEPYVKEGTAYISLEELVYVDVYVDIEETGYIYLMY